MLLAIALWACATAASADPLWQNDLNWLKTMVVAARQTDYNGVFVYQYNDHAETFHISHVTDSEGEYSRLNSLDGARREIIRKNDQVWCYVGDNKAKKLGNNGGRRFPAVLPEQFSLLNENYQIKQTEEGRVAGYHAHAVVFKPKDALRYGHRMWAHSDSGLLLKAEVLDERGHVVEQNTFITLTVGRSVDRSWVKANKQDAASLEHTAFHEEPPQAESLPNASGWQVGMLPPGFKKVTEMRRPLHGRNGPVTHLVFSDGLASISVFIEPIGSNQEDRPALSSRGAIQVYSKVSGNHLLTVVGEAPPRTVMQIADSVRHAGQ